MYEINNLKKKLNNRVENFTTPDDINTAVKKIYLADVEAIRLLSNFAIQLSQGGFTIPGAVNITGELRANGQITTPHGHIIISKGVQHIATEAGDLYLLPKGKVIIGKEWEGTGNLSVQGSIECGGLNINGMTTATGGISLGGDITTNNGHAIRCSGTQHICSEGVLYLLPKEKVFISKDRGSNGNLEVANNIKCNNTITCNKIMITNEITRKYQVAGYYQIKAYGRGMELHYGWNMLWNNDGNSHTVVSRLNVFEYITTNRKGCVYSSNIIYPQVNDNNWYPRKLIIFQGYCVRFFYWNVDSDSNDIFKTGEHQVYDWSVTLKKNYIQQVHLIFVSLIEEEDTDYIKLIDAAQVTCERLVNYDWQKDLFPITMPGHTQTFNNTV